MRDPFGAVAGNDPEGLAPTRDDQVEPARPTGPTARYRPPHRARPRAIVDHNQDADTPSVPPQRQERTPIANRRRSPASRAGVPAQRHRHRGSGRSGTPCSGGPSLPGAGSRRSGCRRPDGGPGVGPPSAGAGRTRAGPACPRPREGEGFELADELIRNACPGLLDSGSGGRCAARVSWINPARRGSRPLARHRPAASSGTGGGRSRSPRPAAGRARTRPSAGHAPSATGRSDRGARTGGARERKVMRVLPSARADPWR